MRYELYGLAENNAFGINNMGYSDDVNITHYGPAKRNNYIIHYVLSGKGYFNNNFVEEGQGFLITPQMPEYYYPDNENPWEIFWITFENIPNISLIFDEYNATMRQIYLNIRMFRRLSEQKIKL